MTRADWGGVVLTLAAMFMVAMAWLFILTRGDPTDD